MSDYTDHDRKKGLKTLHGMGYAQELERSMSRFSNFAISSIICILSGGINPLGPATIAAERAMGESGDVAAPGPALGDQA